MFYALIFISTIFITSSLNSMEITQYSKDITKHTTANFPYPINQKLLLVQQIYQQNNLPRDVINHIQQYSIALDLQNSTDQFRIKWNDFRIPTIYYPFLTPKQKTLLTELLTSEPYWHKNYLLPCDLDTIEFEYYLKSKKDYELFLTLPIDLRKCLALLPSSARNMLAVSSTQKINPKINPTQIICVGTTLNGKMQKGLDFWYYDHHKYPIIPEEKQLSLK
jgi:hypothetical protein